MDASGSEPPSSAGGDASARPLDRVVLRNPLHLLWLLPLLTLSLAAAFRLVAHEPLTAALFVGSPLVGLVLGGACLLWRRALAREMERELGRRTAALAGSQRFLQQLVDASPDPIVISDAAGRVTFFSPAAERVFGYPAAEVVGTRVRDYYVAGPAEAVRVGQFLREGGDALVNFHTRFRRKDGSPLDASLSATFLREERGAVVGVLGVLKDISARVRLEDAQLQAERLRVLGESLAGVAHELNNPLTAVLGFLDLAQRKQPPGIAVELDRAHEAASRMARTVATMLGFARRNDGQRTAVDLAALVREAVGFYGIELRHAGIALELDLAPVPATAADAHQIQQVLLNLLANARDAVRGRPEARVQVSLAAAGTMLRVDVADNGPGIPGELRERVFEPFFTTKPAGAGTGLGLAICRQFVHGHGGRIWFEETPGGGATVVFEVPHVPTAPPRPDRVMLSTPAIHGKTVLVVDDERALRELCAQALGEHAVDLAVNGAEALARLAERRYDAVLCDVRLGGEVSGLDVRAWVAGHRSELLSRFAFVTGDTGDLDTLRRIEATGAEVLAKPFSVEDLRSFVTALLLRDAAPQADEAGTQRRRSARATGDAAGLRSHTRAAEVGQDRP